MAQIAVTPLFMKNATLKVAADNYEASVSSVTFTPSTSTATWKGLVPTSTFSQNTAATWTCDIAYIQDWVTAGSLSLYLFNQEGNAVDVEFRPVAAGPGFKAKLTITPGAIGGAVDSFGTATVSLGVSGKPTILAAGV